MASSLHLLSRIVFFILVVCAPALPDAADEHVSSTSESAERGVAR